MTKRLKHDKSQRISEEFLSKVTNFGKITRQAVQARVRIGSIGRDAAMLSDENWSNEFPEVSALPQERAPFPPQCEVKHATSRNLSMRKGHS